MEAYKIRVDGATVYIKRGDDGSARVTGGYHTIVAAEWTDRALLEAARTVVASMEADRQAAIDRQQAVSGAQQLAHKMAKGEIAATA